MDELLKFYIRKKASIIHKVPRKNPEKVIMMILEYTSKQKPFISRIIGNDILNKYKNKKFQTVLPMPGTYVLGYAGCGLYIEKSVNYCILYEGQFVDNRLFDITAEYDEDFNVIGIYYNNEKLNYNYIPETLMKRLAEINKTTVFNLIKSLKNIGNEVETPKNKAEQLIYYLAKGDVSVTFKSDDGSKPTAFLINYLKNMNGYISICMLNKNDKSRFIDTDFSILTDFYAEKLLKGEVECIRKVVIPMFGVGKYKNVVKNREFVYVGYSDNDKNVPFSDIVVTVSQNELLKLTAGELEIDLKNFELSDELINFIISFKNNFNSRLLNSLLKAC